MNFYTKVYEMVIKIPKGKVATYGQIAAMVGAPRASRAVGYALHMNPSPGEIPCHRVVNRDGRMAPGFAFGGPGEQEKLLAKEKVFISKNGCVDLGKYRWLP